MARRKAIRFDVNRIFARRQLFIILEQAVRLAHESEETSGSSRSPVERRVGCDVEQGRLEISALPRRRSFVCMAAVSVPCTVIDVYQDWTGATVVLEEIFLRLKRQLPLSEYLTFYSANSDRIDALKRYRGYCEPLLLFFGVRSLLSPVS